MREGTLQKLVTYLSALFFGGILVALGWLVYDRGGVTGAPGRPEDAFQKAMGALVERLGAEVAGLALMAAGVLIAAAMIWWDRHKAARAAVPPQDVPFDFAASLARMSARLKAAQSGMTVQEAKAYRETPPGWLADADDRTLLRQYDDNEILLREGVVAWGHIVQANRTLFQPGPADSPAVILYSHDGEIAADPFALGEMAAVLYDVKGDATTPELQRFADMLESEHANAYDVPVPGALTDGRAVLYTTLMIHRGRLPTGLLSAPLFPVVVAPRRSQAATVLPLDFWDPALVEAMW